MTRAEHLARLGVAIEHHAIYGIELVRDEVRQAAYIADTAGIPLSVFREAHRWARQSHEGNFPPTPGQVVKAAREICWRREPDRYRSIQGGGGFCDPKWYARMRAGRAPQFEALEAGEVAKQLAEETET